MKLEQASLESEVVDADPPEKRGRLHGQGRIRRWNAQLANQRAPDPVHRGIEHGMQGRWFGSVREARDWLGVAAPNAAGKGGGQSGSRRGPYDHGCRVMPAEERALTSGVLVKEGRSGD